MHATHARFVALALILVLGAAVAGCGPTGDTTPASTTPAATRTAAPASTTPATPTIPAPGPVTAPATGSASRTAILQAVAKGLGVSGSITVYQLFSDSSAAVGDIQATSGPRAFFAVTGGPSAWKLAWTAPFGSPLAGAKDLTTAAPRVSAELAGKLDFKKVVKKPTSTLAPTISSFKTFVLKSDRGIAGAGFAYDFVITSAKIAKDSKGLWWGAATSEPTTSGLEPIGLWARYSSNKWSGEMASEDPAAYFPGDVIAKLGL